jgi:hypothetical protein
MLTFTVHEPPDPPADRLDHAESLVFVKEGFSWAAAAFGPFWMIANRLWLALLGYLVVYAGLQALVWALEAGQQLLSYMMLALGLLIGFEADSIRRWTLARAGYRMIGAVTGRNAEECERRFFESWLPAQPYIRSEALTQSRLAESSLAPLPSAASGPVSSPPRPLSGWRSAFNFGRVGR